MVPPDLNDQPGLTHPGSLLPILETGALDLILAGHLHRNFPTETISLDVGMKHSTLPVQAGTAISTPERGEANTYTLITLKPRRDPHDSPGLGRSIFPDLDRHDLWKTGNNWVHAATSPPPEGPAAPS